MRIVVLIALMCAYLGCASKPLVKDNIVTPVSDNVYLPVIETYTKSEKKYKGFHNTFQAKVTLMNTKVRSMVLQRRGHFLQWDLDKAKSEREKMFQEMSSHAKVFISFFAPEHDYDDLHKPNSIWKIYLEHQGQRYLGKVKKATEKFVEIQEVFPHYTRFNTPYYVEFSLPTSAVEESPVNVVLTSSLGTAEMKFQP